MSGNKLTGRAAALARRQAQVVGKAALTGQKNTTVVSEKSVSTTVSTPVSSAASAPRRAVVANSSTAREASRARRAAAAARGKPALRSSDRQRSELIREQAMSSARTEKDCGCGCGGDKAASTAPAAPGMSLSAGAPASSKRYEKVNMPNNAGRLNARARRQAMSSKGKKGLDVHRKGLSAVEVMRQQNPEISSREIARNKRAMCSTVGARAVSSGSTPAAGRQRPNRKNPATTGTNVAHSEKITGDEAGLCRPVTGTEYLSSDVFNAFCKDKPLAYPQKVQKTETLSGLTVTTGGKVGRSSAVTGDERGSCKSVTGTEYVGREHFDDFCKTKPEPGSAKVSFSQTTRGQVVSGSKPARASGVTGNEAGTCKAVTGTPYAGVEQFKEFCDAGAVERVSRKNSVMPEVRQPVSGIQPGVTGLTGADRGICKTISGTGYFNAAEQKAACESAPAQPGDSDFPQVMGSVAPVAPVARAGVVTGASQGLGRISGTFSMGQGKVTGTEEFRFGGRDSNVITAAPRLAPEQGAPVNRVTGEGMAVGMKITGNDWDRGDRVTGTEGTSAIKRNMTRRGPISAMTPPVNKRNEEVAQSESLVTGSSGSTEKGALVTVSGGARG